MKKEAQLKEMKKKIKEAEYWKENINKDLEIMEDKERNMEIMLKEEEDLNDKLHNVKTTNSRNR